MIWLVITLMETAEVNAAITGADMKFVRNPEDEITNRNHIKLAWAMIY